MSASPEPHPPPERPQGDAPRKQARQPGDESQMRPRPLTIAPDYQGAQRLKDRRALITGGDSGIGRAVAVHFAREGADVAFMYLDEHEDAQATCAAVEQEGRRCLALPGDARDEAHCRECVRQAAEFLGGIDILVNHLGAQWPQRVPEDIDREQLLRTFETNVYPYFYVTRHALEHLHEGDCIINTASVVSFRGHKELIDYSATKGAVRALTYALATNLAERGIRVNGVAPGPIWTPLIVSSFSQEQIERFGDSTLLKRAGQPSEVAPAFVFLASRDASFITGQFIHVNGGSYVGA